MTLSCNPYLNRTAVKDARHFFGRRREIGILFSRINADEPQSVSIIGERKVGKSSLLRALLNQREKYLRRPDEYVFLYSDLQERIQGGVSEFFSMLMEEVALAGHDPTITQRPPTYESFRKLVADLARSRMKLILLLDEFDAITQNRGFTLEFYSFMRSLPNNYAVSYVITSARELLEYCHSKEIAGSPFFNIFHKLNLGGFSHEEAMELITRPSEEAGYSLQPFAHFIIKLAGCFPFFLQLACCLIFEYLQAHQLKQAPDLEFIQQRFYEETRDHFEYLYAHFTDRERIVCQKVIRHEQLERSDRTFLANLKQRGYIRDTDQGVGLFSDVFESFIEEKRVQELSDVEAGFGHSADPSIRISDSKITEYSQLLGTRIGRFIVKKLLGSGSMGSVYLAEDAVLKRSVALKRILPLHREDPNYRKRFLKEAERASQFSDPHIAGIYDLFEAQGELFLVMEYVDGCDLRRRFGEPMSVREFLHIAMQCVDALASAHERGIVHCDIKPENILLTASCQVKILDFGLAKHMPQKLDVVNRSSAAVTTEIFGCTPCYAAPEYLLDYKADNRSDIFSLGVVFYEALGRQHPFLSPTWAQTVDRIIHQTPTLLKDLNPEIPDRLADIVNKCLQKEPENRYQSASIIAEDLCPLNADRDA